MTQKNVTNLAASVRQRLLNKARVEGRIFQELATLYLMERFLFRLGQSEHVDQFVLKGGLMTLTWAGEQGRVTRDIDLLGWGANSVEAVVARMKNVLTSDVADDGVTYDLASLMGERILSEAEYVGVRVRVRGELAGMVLQMQIDVGFGDAVVPAPDWVEYPQLLDLGSPRVLGYPPEATLAEKLHAICSRGLVNSRMKDYYDLWTASRLKITTTEGLGEAIEHTFGRRDTQIPIDLPEGLSDAFSSDASKRAQWSAFLRKSRLERPSLDEAVNSAAELALPAFEAARTRA